MKTETNTQSGNVFMFILLGIVLFAALGFVVSRGMRTETTTAMSQRQAELAAVDILDYAQKIERAVSKLLARGISENDIDFTNNVVAGYPHTPVLPNANRVFDTTGGNVSWRNPEDLANDGSPWLFTGETCIPDVGNGGAGCSSDSVKNEELLAVLPNLDTNVCDEINKRLSIAALPVGGDVSTDKFTGSFADGQKPTNTAGLTAACFENAGGDKIFYFVLIAR